MTGREKLMQVIEILPESQIAQVLDYIHQVMAENSIISGEQNSQVKPCFDETCKN